jgi:hypothetical protein
MKGSIGGTGVLFVLLCSTAVGQELSVGPAVGALFTQGAHGHLPGMHGSEVGTSYSFGAAVVYSLSSLPLDFVGQAFYAPLEGHYRLYDSLAVPPSHEGHRGNEPSLCSLGLGGRWVPLRGPVSPYLGLSLLVSHQEGVGASYSLNSPFELGGNLNTTGFGAVVLFTLF